MTGAKILTSRQYDILLQFAETGAKEHGACDPADPKGPWVGLSGILEEIETQNYVIAPMPHEIMKIISGTVLSVMELTAPLKSKEKFEFHCAEAARQVVDALAVGGFVIVSRGELFNVCGADLYAEVLLRSGGSETGSKG